MYLKQAVIENSGALKWLDLSLAFSDDGSPKPLILVGGNGSGKTNFLALIADALFEAAAAHFTNVLPSQAGGGRAWFRLVGGRTITTGAKGAFTLLKFDDEGNDRFFSEKAGDVDPASAALRVPQGFGEQMRWPKEGTFKDFPIEDERAANLFETGVYTYFPSSRSEVPYWLNREAVPETSFDVSLRLSKRLMKPIYVERALDEFKQWLMGVLSDIRTEIYPTVKDGNVQWSFTGNPTMAMQSSPVMEQANKLLRAILNDDGLRFVWMGRKSSDKIAIYKGNKIFLPNLDALSAGQSILLGTFGTILRYADNSRMGSGIDAEKIHGICLIDEIDAHIHVELQYRIIPNLIKLFPNIQYIISTHSPIFVLGMEKEFGPEGMQVVEMPNGIPVSAETYEEFGHALEAVAASKAFTNRVMVHAREGSKPIVYVEGETDAPYLRKAAELLSGSDILEACDIEWIGATDEKGQGFHTGAAALKQTLSVLRANPGFSNRKILLLYDNDSKTPDADYESVSVRSIPISGANTKVTIGIENLLPEECLSANFYQEKTVSKPDGGSNISLSLRKSDLCKHMCETGTAEQFAEFAPTLEIIRRWLGLESPSGSV